MKTYFLLIYAFFLLGLKTATAEVLTGELENPGYDPLFWVSSSKNCSEIEEEASKRYLKSNNRLLEIERTIVMNDLCHSAKACNLKWCKNKEDTLVTNNSVLSNKSESMLDSKTILSLEMKAKAELGKLLIERRDKSQQSIEQAEKTEHLEKLTWEKLIMPFDNEQEIKPIIPNKPIFVNPNLVNTQPAVNPGQVNIPIKKDK